MVVHMSDAQFEQAVDDALARIPDDLLNRMENVAILVEDEPDTSNLPDGQTLLGLYVGTPLPERLDAWGYGSLPDRIFIFKGPLTRLARSREQLLREIEVTVRHEIGHHFGISDDRLHELGWG
ncbi:metallopeptidase family protein [Leekyejoonella antrihumi]|uniref:Metallopeptidase family protein n=1 Tax=Leekyejoonella antrihumi TaxID=1660198 RepID=A0A563E386_9MICO|nr:metallopeptidase family protein [Leekyejoonella antrihumi]TWP36996.1 metallopeptidase family protein [Leekyejoonella antrihumi]